MLGITLLIITFVVLGAMMINPKLGVILLWPMLFMYPHYLMWRMNLMPLNIGVDDLFMCVFFLIVLVRRNLLGGLPIRMGHAVWGALAFFLVLIIVNVNSYFLMASLAPEFIKTALKGAILTCMVYSLVNTIDDIRDLRMLAFSFAFFVGVSAVIVILQNFFPGPMKIFSSPVLVERADLLKGQRPVGAFMNANNAALVMGIAILVIISTLRIKSRYFTKPLRFMVMGILVVGVLATRSRSGFLCLLAPVLWMAFVGRSKGYAWVFLTFGVVLFALLPGMSAALFGRFTAATQEDAAGFWEPIALRHREVLRSWENATLRRMTFGQNSTVDTMTGYLPPHSGYFGITLKYGIAGTIWIIVLFAILIRKSGVMKRHPDLTISCLGDALRLFLLVAVVFFIGGSMVGSYVSRYTLFMMVVLAHRGADFAREQSMVSCSAAAAVPRLDEFARRRLWA